MVERRSALGRAQGQGEKAMQTRAAVGVMMAAALFLGGCAGGGGLFRDRDERDDAARLLLQRQADEEAALREDEAEAEAAREAQDKRALKALQEQDEDAERRKREEAEDLQQERRHRRERKEAEHDAKIRELHRGSRAPKPPEKLPQHWIDYLNAGEAVGRAYKAKADTGSMVISAKLLAIGSAAHWDSFNQYNSAVELASEAHDNFRKAATIRDAAATQLERDVYNELSKKTGAPPLNETRNWDGLRIFYMTTEALEIARKDYPPRKIGNDPNDILEARRAYDAANGIAWEEHFTIMQAVFTPEAIAAERSRRNETARAGAAGDEQSAAANCYDGPKMLIRPHETMGDFEARCGPRTPTRADAAR